MANVEDDDSTYFDEDDSGNPVGSQNYDEDDELDAFMAGIEKEAAKDKEVSEEKAKKLEDNQNALPEPSNRIDLQAEDEGDEFVMNYDPNKLGYGDEEDEIDDYSLATSVRDEEGNIIYEGQKRRPMPSDVVDGVEQAVLEPNKIESNVSSASKVPPKSTKPIMPSTVKDLKKYAHWGFIPGNVSKPLEQPVVQMPEYDAIPPPPPPPSSSTLQDEGNDEPKKKRSRWN